MDPSVQESLYDNNGCGQVKIEAAQLIGAEEAGDVCSGVQDTRTKELLYGTYNPHTEPFCPL